MHRIAIELTRRAFTVRVELTPEESAPVAAVPRGVINAGERPGLAKTRPSNVVRLPMSGVR